MSVFHDEIEIEDFEFDEDDLTYYYPCPCGDRFQITKEELLAGEDVATCPSCSLIVKVIYDPVYLKMGARGRGRGGGRGRGMSFSVEALGFGIGESLPGPVLAPPSLFPTLANPPVSLRAEDKKNSSFGGDIDWDYCVMVKKEMVAWLWDASPFSSILGTPGDCGRSAARLAGTADVERYSDRYQVSANQRDAACFHWSHLPKELRPGKEGLNKNPGKRKRKEVKKAVAKEDITKRLAELEEREVHGEEGSKETKEEGAGGEEEGEEGEEGEGDEEEEEEEDEEMDAGTDYISSYFDNGEGYLDEDDDGDDGPTY